MQEYIENRYSDYAAYFPINKEEINYVYTPSSNAINVQPNTLVEIMPYYTYYPKIEYFFLFHLNENITFLNSNTFDTLTFFRRTAGILLPIAEISYHYEYSKTFSYTNYIKYVASLLAGNTLAVQILTQSNVSIPKNDETLLVSSTKNLTLKYQHSGYRNFTSKTTNQLIEGQRIFSGVRTPCEECIQDEILKNYDKVKSLTNQ